jgi:four helix bundle protein
MHAACVSFVATMLDHERLAVYRLARELRKKVIALLRAVPRGHGETVDQLNRCSLSIKLNIAEGTGEYAPREKAKLYRIARREAAECAALLEDLEDLGVATAADLSRARHLIRRIIGGLVRLVTATESRQPSPKPTPTPAPKPAPAPTPSPTP